MLIGLTKGNDTLRFSYDAAGNAAAVDHNGTYYYYLRNGQGDIVKIVDGSGNTVVEYTYDSWGKPLSCTGTLATTLGALNPFRYRGYVYDEETEFYYLKSRYYAPETCRFISADVLLSTGQGALGHNCFVYCLNNPINRKDQNGCVAVCNFLTGCVPPSDEENEDSETKRIERYRKQKRFFTYGRCYQYATGLPSDACYPGEYHALFPQYNNDGIFEKESTLIKAILEDYQTAYQFRKYTIIHWDLDTDSDIGPGEWIIAYCVSQSKGFHFLRYDTDSGWTHKKGPAMWGTDLDFAGNKIYDIRDADLDSFEIMFCFKIHVE